MPEHLPAVGTVRLGSFLQLGRDAEQARQQEHRLERHARPHVRDNDRRHRQRGIAKPDRLRQPQQLQRIVDPAGVVVEHCSPAQRYDDRSGHDRQQVQRPNQAQAAEATFHQHGEPEADQRVDGRRADHQIQRVEDDSRGLRIAHQFDEILDADEVPGL